MDDGHMFDYNQLHRSAFLEHKYNFRSALMYFKRFMFPQIFGFKYISWFLILGMLLFSPIVCFVGPDIK
jgi:hypothetical protein